MELTDLLSLPKLEDCKSLLCVQPHPDDNEVGAGATIAKLSAKGCKVTYLTVTDGRMGSVDPKQDQTELVSIRKKEVEQSAELLGVSDTIFLNFRDGDYSDEKQLCKSIVAVIRQVKPEIVLTVDPFLPYEFHPDHRKVGMATAQACMFGAFPNFLPDEKTKDTWAVRGIAFHTTAYPNTFLNVDDTWDLKMKSLSLHKSQFDAASLQRVGYYFDFKARGYAQGKGFTRAEAFKVLSPDCLHMFVDAINI